jgi:hypothetical protein
MHKIIVSILSAAIFFGPSALVHARLVAQGSSGAPPDFSGVYYPVQQGRGGGQGQAGGAPPARRGGPPPRPTTSAPISDGSQGRAPDAPSLTPEYLAKWETMRKSRIAGSYEFDNNAKCLPPGMPAMMGMAYGMEVMQTKDKITFFSELNDALRRVYLDGRKPTPKVLDDRGHGGAAHELVYRGLHAAQRRDDGEGAHPIHRAWPARGSHHGHRSESADQTLGDGEDVPKGDARERSAQGVRLRRGT